MDGWLKDLANVAQKQVNDLTVQAQQQGALLTERLATLGASDKKDCEFEDGPLGFELEGNLVISVEACGQADEMSVEVGDRLVEIAGWKVPKFKPGDVDAEESASRKVRKWLKEMPRPCRLTFKPPKPAAELAEGEAAGDSSAAAAASPEDLADAAGAPAEVFAETAAASAEEEEQGWGPAVDGPGGGGGGDEASAAAPAAAAAEAGCPVEASLELGTDECGGEEAAGGAGAGAGEAQASPQAAAAEPLAASPSPSPSLSPSPRAPSPAAAAGVPPTPQALPAPPASAWRAPPPKASNEELRKLLEQTRLALDGERRKSASLLDQVGSWRAKSKELQHCGDEVTRLRGALASLEEAEGDAARLRPELAAALERAGVAEERLRGSQAAALALKEELDQAAARAAAAERSTAQAQARAAALSRELQGFQQAHEAELEVVREELHERGARELDDGRRALRQQEQQAAEESAKVRGELEELRRALALEQASAVEARARADDARTQAEAAGVECAAVRAAERGMQAELSAARATAAAAQAAAAAAAGTGSEPERPGAALTEDLEFGEAPPPDANVLGAVAAASASGEDPELLHQRIASLERRCAALQRKLSSQVLAASAAGSAGGGQSHPPWLPLVAARCGPRAGAVTLAAFSATDKALRTFTLLLLKQSARLWLFYVHLVVLYTMVARSSGTDSLAPLDALGKQMVSQVVVVNGTALGVTGMAAP